MKQYNLIEYRIIFLIFLLRLDVYSLLHYVE